MTTTTLPNKAPRGHFFVNGAFLQGENFQTYARKNGLCDICGKFQTHEKHGRIFKKVFTPLTVKNDKGEYQVYKGMCIQPTCYTLDEAKQRLGEKHRRRNHAPAIPLAPAIRPPESPNNSLPSSGRSNRKSIEDLTDSSDHNGYNPLRNSGTEASLKSSSTLSNSSLPCGNISPPGRNQWKTLSSNPKKLSGAETFLESSSTLSNSPLPSNNFSPMSKNSWKTQSSISDTLTPNDPRKLHHTKSPEARTLREGRDIPVIPFPTMYPDHENPPSSFHDSMDPLVASSKKIVETLIEAGNAGDYVRLMTQLESNSSKPEVVKQGLHLLRTTVYQKHRQQPNSYLFITDAWVKSLKSILVDSREIKEVQEDVVLTLWVLGLVSRRYLNDIIKYGVVKDVTTMLENHRGNSGMEEKCCGILEMFTAQEQGGLDLQSEHIKSVIKALMQSIAFMDSSGKESALQALFNIATKPTQIKTGESMDVIVRDAIPGSRGIDLIVQVALALSINPLLAKSAIRLLWIMAAPSGGVSTITPSDKIIDAILSAAVPSAEHELHEAAYGLLANLTVELEGTNHSGFPITRTEAVTSSILQSLQSQEWSEIVQIAGLHALSNIFFYSKRKAKIDHDMAISCIIGSMNAYSADLEIQSLGCLALAYLCLADEERKVSVVFNGGIQVLARAISFSTPSSTPAENMQSLFELPSNACLLVSTLAVSPFVMEQLQGTQIFFDIKNILQISEANLLPPGIKASITHVLSFTSASIPTLSDDNSLDSALDALMKAVTSEEEVEMAVASIYNMSVKASSNLDELMTAWTGTGTTKIAELMATFPRSVAIQENGCKILSEIYFRVPFQGFNQISCIDLGPRAFGVKTHSEEEVKVLLDCFRDKKMHFRVLEKAALALSNFFHGHVNDSDKIRTILSGSLHEAVNVMVIHENTLELQINCLRWVRVVLCYSEYTELQRWCPRIVDRIITAMTTFQNNTELQTNACLALLSIMDKIDDDESIALIGQTEGVQALVASLCSTSMEVVDFASEVVAVVVRRLFTALSEIVEGHDSCDVIIGCMFRFSESYRIQAHCCSILWSLGTLHERYVKPMIANAGGVQSILQALVNYGANEMVQEYGCKALSAISTGMQMGTIEATQHDLAHVTIHALRAHLTNPEIQTSVFELIAFLCTKDNFFTKYFSTSEGIPLVIETMNRHIPNLPLQSAGITSLWSLASFGDNKRLIGEYGGLHAIINSLLFHINSSSLQKEGMTTLKNLATTSINKQIITQYRGEESILWCLWVNMDSPVVLGAAFSALNNIAVDTEHRRVTSVSSALVSCILVAMRRFKTSETVQTNACFLLKSYTFEPTNLALMVQRKNEFITVLTLAARIFPKECGERAQLILSKL